MLVLASTSRYRAELLSRLGVDFTIQAPECDETVLKGESPAATAQRLARLKAHSLLSAKSAKSADRTESVESAGLRLILGSDQVASIDGSHIGKPGTRQNAIQQLREAQGRTVEFYTAVCILDGVSGQYEQRLDTTCATLRTLDQASIERYVDADEPFDCAGSFKVEQLGISLFSEVKTSDPTALTGLPLIGVCECLRAFGYALP